MASAGAVSITVPQEATVARAPASSPPTSCCPSCGSSQDPISSSALASVICPDCGCVISDDVELLTYDASYTERHISDDFSRNTVDDVGITDAMYKTTALLRRSGAKGPEASKANQQLADAKAFTQVSKDLKTILLKLSHQGTSSGNHPLLDRILSLFKQFRAASRDEEQMQAAQSFLSHSNHVGRFRWGEGAKAALCVCVYAVFRLEDMQMQDAAMQRCHSLALIAHHAEVPLAKAQKWMRLLRIIFRVSDYVKVKSDAPILHVDQVVHWFSQPSARLTPAQRRAIADVPLHKVRTLARGICHNVLQHESFAPHVYRFASPIACGEWAHFAVLWAIAGVGKKRLQGKVWVKQNLIRASLGGHEGHDDEVTAQGQCDDVADAHVAAYHLVGDALAQRAKLIPWVGASQKNDKRRKRPGARSLADVQLKEDQVVHHIEAVIDFAPSLNTRYEERLREQAQSSVATEDHGRPGQRSQLPDDARIRKQSPSFTSLRYPDLSGAPALIDEMSDEQVDEMLFAEEEMHAYLRTPEEVDALRTIQEAAGDKESVVEHERKRSRPVNRPSAKRTKRTKADARLEALARDSGGARDQINGETTREEWSSDDET